MSSERDQGRHKLSNPLATIRAVGASMSRPRRVANGARSRNGRGPRNRWLLAAGAGLVLLCSELVIGPAVSASADSCGPNPVVCENAKPGTPESQWQLQDAGDPTIQGFATDISVNLGQRIDFKIKTPASAYTIKVFRLGYYQGNGARFITNVTPSAHLPQIQPGACVTQESTALYDCGNWAVSASWTVPTDAVSGVYIALLSTSTGASQITFVVRDDSSTSALYFKTSDATWQAYNTYGGADFYSGGDAGRAYKISYNRPFATRNDNDGRSFLYSNEFPMIEFLERNGYDVSYTTDVDADRHGDLIKNHKTFLSVGHDEYWSYGERTNVEGARDAGVNLAFFSGNEVYWRTRWDTSQDGSNTPYRTLISYKETWSNDKVDPTSQWTGTYRDPRFSPPYTGGGNPENGLTGTLYMSNDTDLPIQVPAVEGKDRIWRGTSVASLGSSQTATLAPHTVGYESDEDLDNGFRPAGLIDMSTTVGATPEELTDFGNTTVAGTTTHHITLYKASSGALVFSSGSIQWSWGLSTDHDGVKSPVDPAIQQATINLLADMGAQATTVMSGLVAATKSTDTVGPTVSVTTPPTSAVNGAAVTLHGTAADTGGGVVAGVEVSNDGGTTWHPATWTTSPMSWTATVYATGTTSDNVLVRGIDDSANKGASTSVPLALTGPSSLFGNRTPGTPAAPDSGAAELGIKFVPQVAGTISGVRFYKGTGNTGTHTGSLWTVGGDQLATGTFSNETTTGWQTLTFSSPVPVTKGTTYVASYFSPKGHEAADTWAFAFGPWTSGPLVAPQGQTIDGSNGVFQESDRFPDENFGDTNYYVDVMFNAGTATPPPPTAPTVTSTNPAANAAGVSTSVAPSATFSTAMNASTITFTLKNGATSVAGTSAYNTTSKTATFTPSAALAPGATYTATVNGSDSTGVAMAAAKTWTFSTQSNLPTSTYTIFPTNAVPTTLNWNDPSANEIGVKFSSDTDGVVTGVRFYKRAENTGIHTGSLWSSTGTLLATATFTGETGSGWETVLFSQPVAIAKNTTYVASYHTNSGEYALDLNGLASGVNNSPLHVPANGGLYSYGSGAFPTSTSPHNLWVDVLFRTAAAAPTVTSSTPAANATGVSTSVHPTATFSTSVNPSSISFTVKQGSTTVPGTVTYSDSTKTATFTPSAALAHSTAYTATVSASNTGGTAMASPFTWSFTTAAAASGPAVTIFPDTATPANVNWSDPSPNSLGVQFTSDVAGTVTGVRFYKGPLNTGVHTGSLWTSSGTLLTTATFANETASGWQTVMFDQPVAITPGTTYVASYSTTVGYYAVDLNEFNAPLDNAPLHIPVNGGMYNYSGGFPSNAIAHNVWVDVVFQPGG